MFDVTDNGADMISSMALEPNKALSNAQFRQILFIELEFFVRSYQHNERYNKRYKISEKAFLY